MKRFVSILCCLVMILVSIPFSASAAAKSIDFTEETIDSTYFYDGFHDTTTCSLILTSDDEQAAFLEEYDNRDENVTGYLNNLPDDFYNTKALILIESSTPCLWGYEFSVRSVKKSDGILTVKLDWWEIDLDQAKPDAIGCYATMIMVDKSDVSDVTELKVIKTDLRENLAENPNFLVSDIFDEDAFGGNFKDGLLYVIDSVAKAEEFVDLCTAYDYYIDEDIEAYFGNLAEDFFEEKVVLTSVFHSGCPDSTYFDVRVTKVDGVMSIVYDYYGPEADREYECICQYYVNTVELDKDLLNGVTAYSLFRRDRNVSTAIDFTGHVFDVEIVDGYPAPVIISSAAELADVLAEYDSDEFAEFAEGLADDYFDNNILVVAYSKEQYDNVNYSFNKIYDLSNKTDLMLYVDADVADARRNENGKLFVYELDNDYKNSTFYLAVCQINVPGIFSDKDVTIGLNAMTYVLLKRNYFATYNLSELQQYNADINNNGAIDPMDYMLIKRCYFGTYVQMDLPE